MKSRDAVRYGNPLTSTLTCACWLVGEIPTTVASVIGCQKTDLPIARNMVADN